MMYLEQRERWERLSNQQREPSGLPRKLGNPFARPALFVSIALYGVSLIKFYVRDPLVAETGPQGPLELALVILACLAAALAFREGSGNLSFPFPAKAFAVFGALAVVSSIFSYYPLLSFLKGVSFLLVCGIAVLATSAFRSRVILTYLYYLIVILLVAGCVAKLAGGNSLLLIDDYSGRARFSLFAWHPGTLADLSALTLLSGLLLAKRPPLYCQAVLFAINIATAARASSLLLIAVLVAIGLASARLNPRFLLLCCGAGSLLTIGMMFAAHKDYRPADLGLLGQGLYGDKLDQDLTTLSGRTEVWSAAAPLLSHCLFLGYGLEGARDVLFNNTTWGAGNTHNSLIDLILSGGIPATFVYLLGWAIAARRAWRSQGLLRLAALGTYAYLAGFGMVSPNLTYLQGLASFLILTIDALVRAEFSLRESASQRAFVWADQHSTPPNAIGTHA